MSSPPNVVTDCQNELIIVKNKLKVNNLYIHKLKKIISLCSCTLVAKAISDDNDLAIFLNNPSFTKKTVAIRRLSGKEKIHVCGFCNKRYYDEYALQYHLAFSCTFLSPTIRKTYEETYKLKRKRSHSVNRASNSINNPPPLPCLTNVLIT